MRNIDHFTPTGSQILNTEIQTHQDINSPKTRAPLELEPSEKQKHCNNHLSTTEDNNLLTNLSIYDF